MKVIELKREMDTRFAEVEARFTGVDARFDKLEARLVSEVAAIRAEVRALVTEEGATTRRYFDVVAESLRSDIRLIAEGQTKTNEILAAAQTENSSAHATFVGALDDHELRLRALERARG